jgi:hypothetical protein
MQPNAFTGGPGYFIYDGILYQLMDENWNIDIEIVTTDRKTNLQGFVGKWEEYVRSKVTGKPIALYSQLQTQLDKLVPYRANSTWRRGKRIRSNTDKPLVVHLEDGRTVTFVSAILTKQPSIQCAPNKDFFGSVEFTCLRKAGDDGSADDDHVVEGSASYVEPVLDTYDIVNCKFTLSLGASSPLNNIETDENGIQFEPTVTFKDLLTARDGLLNMQIDNISLGIKFSPQNLSAANLVNTLVKTDGVEAGRGTRLGNRGLTLTVTGESHIYPLITVPLAVASQGKLNVGTGSRVGEVSLMAERTTNDEGDAMLDLFTLAAVEED